MFKKIIDVVVCSALVLAVTAGGVQSLTRHEMHTLGAYVVTSVGYACDAVEAMKPAEAEHVYDLRCTVGRTEIGYTINARTGEVWRS